MELRQLRYFVAAAEERHFGRAAQRLRIAQSGLSQQIQALERSLRVRLFDRDSRPIELTAEGEILLEQARLIIELADRVRERVRQPDGLTKTILKFGGSSFGNGPVVDRVLTAARTRLTDVDLQVFLDTTAHNVLALNRRALDVAFAYLPFESEKTPRFLRLGTIDLVLALPQHHRLSSADRIPRDELLKEPFLIGPRSINPPLFEHVHRSLIGRVDHPNAVEISDVGTARFRLVAAGAGITPVALPTESLLPITGVVYRRVEDPPPTIEYGLVWFDEHVSPALPAFLDLAREITAETPDPVDGGLSLTEA
jgi:DNA-binding transcriptional LysR family regulator